MQKIALILLGAFLFVDSLFLGWLTMAYPEQIAWLDQYIGYWLWGIIFIAIGLIGLRRK